jgi:hypothetical protein
MSEPNYALVRYRTGVLLKKAEDESLTEFEFEDANAENLPLYVATLEKKGWVVEARGALIHCSRAK